MARRALQVLAVVAAVIVVLVVVVAVAGDRLATWGIRRQLAGMEGYRGELGRAHFSLAGPSVSLEGLTLYDRAIPGSREPAVLVPRARADLGWGSLLRGRPVVSLALDGPRLLVQPEPRPKEQPPLAERLRQSSPLLVRSLTVRDGTLVSRSAGGKRREVRLEHVEAEVHDLATRPELAGGRPVTGRIRGLLEGSGKVDLTLSADPFAKPAQARVAGSVSDLRVRDAIAMAASAPAGLSPGGTLTTGLDLTLANDRLTGTLLPGVSGLEAPSAVRGLAAGLEAAGSSGLAGGVGERLGAVTEKARPVLKGRATAKGTVPIDLPAAGGPGQLRAIVGALAQQALVAAARAGIQRFAPAGTESSLERLRQGAESLLPGFGKSNRPAPGESAGAKP